MSRHHRTSATRRGRRAVLASIVASVTAAGTLVGLVGTAPPAPADPVPCPPPAAADIAPVAAGGLHSLMVVGDGGTSAWGANTYGQLGNGSYSTSAQPNPVQGSVDSAAVAAGFYHSVAADARGTVWAWGENGYGQLARPTSTTTKSNVPLQVAGLEDVTALAAGGFHTLARKADGSVWVWGYGSTGQLGNGTFSTSQTTPVQASIADVVAVASRGWHNLALKSDGTVWTWGFNNAGQLGVGTTLDSATPAQVAGLTNVVAVAAGSVHSLAVRADGTVWAWGDNDHGQLGNTNTTLDHLTPVQVAGISGAAGAAAGDGFTLVRKGVGTLWALGRNASGQLGDGTTTNRTSPVRSGTLTGVEAVSAGFGHVIASTADDQVWTWGDNDLGQLGLATTLDRSTPTFAVGRTCPPNVAPDAPTLVEPSDGAVIIEGHFVTFTISTADGNGDRWTGEITTSGPDGAETFMTDVTYSGEETSLTVALPPGAYTWSAVAEDWRGARSAASVTRSFTVVPTPPSMECEFHEFGAELLETTVLGVHTKVYAVVAGAPEGDICYRIDDANTATGIGGKIHVEPRQPDVEVTGIGTPSIGIPTVDSQSTACTSPLNPPNQLPGAHPYVSGSIAGLVSTLVDAYSNGSAVWLCLRAGTVSQPDVVNVRVVLPLTPPTIGTPGVDVTPYPLVTITPDA